MAGKRDNSTGTMFSPLFLSFTPFSPALFCNKTENLWATKLNGRKKDFKNNNVSKNLEKSARKKRGKNIKISDKNVREKKEGDNC